jgi:catechol 2,3-dioxygenase-like lactoylglutathione lyase family enzyme
MRIEKVSAVTFRVLNMKASVRFYGDVLGMDVLYGGEDTPFSSLRTKDAEYPILNLEQGRSVAGWGRMIFYVADLDAFWEYLRGKGFNPESPRDASWGERYFHMPDPDGHECHLRVRSSSLPTTAKTHRDRGAVCEETCATLMDACFVRDGVPGMKQHSGYVPGS